LPADGERDRSRSSSFTVTRKGGCPATPRNLSRTAPSPATPRHHEARAPARGLLSRPGCYASLDAVRAVRGFSDGAAAPWRRAAVPSPRRPVVGLCRAPRRGRSRGRADDVPRGRARAHEPLRAPRGVEVHPRPAARGVGRAERRRPPGFRQHHVPSSGTRARARTGRVLHAGSEGARRAAAPRHRGRRREPLARQARRLRGARCRISAGGASSAWRASRTRTPSSSYRFSWLERAPRDRRRAVDYLVRAYDARGG